MPNWVKNRVIARDFSELKKHLVNDKGEVDFNMVVPMPEDLHITSGSYSYELPSKYFPNFDDKKKLEKQSRVVDVLLKELYNETITQQDFYKAVMQRADILKEIRSIKGWYTRKTKNHEYPMSKGSLEEGYETYIKGFFNMQRYGERDWYEWSIKNWDTKWNACDGGFVDEDCQVIEFETAWSMPEAIFRKLAKYTPIRVVYADEDLGANCGMEDYYYDKDSDSVEMNTVMEGSLELACDTWGYSHVPAYDEDWNELPEDDEKFKEKNKHYFQIQEEIRTLMTTECLKKDFVEV